MKADDIIAKLIQQIEIGAPPWRLPWACASSSGLPINLSTRKPYQGTNILVLWAAQAIHGYETGQWLGFDQARKMGGNVRKGEKSTWGVIYKPYTTETDEGATESRAYLSSFNVFNLDQVDGLDHLKTPIESHQWEPMERAEQIMSASGAVIEYGGDRACYAPKPDKIRLPERTRFSAPADFYATALHELGHWTGHESRLNRQYGKRFGDDAYAREELVAEISCAITCARLGIDGEVNHASYLDHWVKVLKQSPRFILTAASAASAASNYLLRTTDEEA